MTSQELTLAAAAGGVSLAICATLWALAQQRVVAGRVTHLNRNLKEERAKSSEVAAASDLFQSALIAIDAGHARLLAGAETLRECAAVLLPGGNPDASANPQAVIEAMARAQPEHARKLEALIARGEACAFEVVGAAGRVAVEARAAGALAWMRLSPVSPANAATASAPLLSAFLDARPEPAWIAGRDGPVVWANQAWLSAVGAETVEDAQARDAGIDRAVSAMAREVAAGGASREMTRWVALSSGRRAFRFRASRLDLAGAAVWADDVSEAQNLAESVKRSASAQEQTLTQVADAVAIFDAERRLAFHNPAFSALWGLDTAWLAERPAHAEVLDRLRQLRRLPETVDYPKFRASELARYESLTPAPEALWRLPGERTLRVVGTPQPRGGLIMIFSDITPELRLKTQFNHLIQVQQATLDKLTDAVAVFGSDGRLKIHNEAFEAFWGVDAAQLAAAPDYDAIVEMCVHRLHDLQFWRDLKGRITDPDPKARAPLSDEVLTADRRTVAWQSRPLPDGATLISFADVTDTRRLEGALRDREAALADTERLKREFVGSVSYELRTPLTTIIGYSELLERGADSLGERARAHVAAVRTAATHLARSIDNVLDMAEIDAGEMALDIEDIDVAELLSGATQRWAREAAAGGVEMVIAADAEPGLIRGDPKRLTQVLDHLTQNAVRHTPPGGAVTLSAKRALGEIRIQVSDTGRGIPFHVQAHIFDRFGGNDRGGPGLGLALVKAIVELHGGWVALESEPGAGASFTCHLPEAAQVSAARPELF